MDEPLICSKCDECKRKQEEFRNRQQAERFDMINSLFEVYIEKNNEQLQDSVYLNADLLDLAIISYYDDIYRYKEYSNVKYADRHKQAAYTLKWLSKMKPIQIKEGYSANKYALNVNGSFAIFVSLTFLRTEVAKNISDSYLNFLLYSCLYRNISGKLFAGSFYLLECNTIEEEDVIG
ncbi:MAG: hypothetical protein LBQ73_04685 [Tannerellaceae bacterium]|jgi:hypothetical protein|nr:hypothetical protein [Tannerellaceae bacterium]